MEGETLYVSFPHPSGVRERVVSSSPSPLNAPIRGPQSFKPKKKAKTWIPDKKFRE